MKKGICRDCGTIHQNTAQNLIALKNKIDKRLYVSKYGGIDEKMAAERFEPIFEEMWEWRETISELVGGNS